MAELRVLIVCTANVCRSPVVEGLAMRALRSHGLPATVTSAGTTGGSLSVHRYTFDAAADIGVDLSAHQSRLLDEAIINDDGRDLVITMTRQHLERVVELEPAAFARAFTLPELAGLATEHGVDPVTRDLAEWLTAISSDRTADDVISGGEAYDVEDPYGAPRILHRRMVEQVDALVNEIVKLLAASVDPAER